MVGGGEHKVVLDESGFSAYRVDVDWGLNLPSVNEGSVWEAAMMAPAQKLGNLCVVVDYNKWQATGRSNETLNQAPLADKWRAFGWEVHDIDRHDIATLVQLMDQLPDGSGKPIAIIANTVKGKGVSFMEAYNNWHHRIPTAEEVAAAHKELGLS